MFKNQLFKVSKCFVELSAIVYLVIGLLTMSWATTNLVTAETMYTSVQSGSDMISGFIAVGISIMAAIGSRYDNYCLLMANGCIQVSSFAVRAAITMVKLKVCHSKWTLQEPTDGLPDMISGLPRTSGLAMSVSFCAIELSLACCSFYLSKCILRKNSLLLFDTRYFLSHDTAEQLDFTNVNFI
ncbi:hypothetical protein HDE_01874 [Halotydeus destructor]|nr:hypothetical protein HDE_01874 [Halotydeus destructor]